MAPKSYFTFIYAKLVTRPGRSISYSTHSLASLVFIPKRGGLKQTFKCLTRQRYRSTDKSIKKEKKKILSTLQATESFKGLIDGWSWSWS